MKGRNSRKDRAIAEPKSGWSGKHGKINKFEPSFQNVKRPEINEGSMRTAQPLATGRWKEKNVKWGKTGSSLSHGQDEREKFEKRQGHR